MLPTQPHCQKPWSPKTSRHALCRLRSLRQFLKSSVKSEARFGSTVFSSSSAALPEAQLTLDLVAVKPNTPNESTEYTSKPRRYMDILLRQVGVVKALASTSIPIGAWTPAETELIDHGVTSVAKQHTVQLDLPVRDFPELAKLNVLDSIFSASASWPRFVTSLNLEHCRLRSIPSSIISSCVGLRHLNLARNNLTDITGLETMTQLTSLDVSYNQIQHLPELLAKLTLLRTLSVQNNKLTSIPDWLCDMTSLTTLLIRANGPYSDFADSMLLEEVHNQQRCKAARSTHNCMTPSEATTLLKDMLRSRKDKKDWLQIQGSRACSCSQLSGFWESPIDVIAHYIQRGTPPYVAALETEALTLLADETPQMRDSHASRSLKTISSFSSRGSKRWMSGNDPQYLLDARCCRHVPSRTAPTLVCLHTQVSRWLLGSISLERLERFRAKQDFAGNSAFHIAVIYGASSSKIMQLLRRYFNPRLVNADGATFLHLVPSSFWEEDMMMSRTLLNALSEQTFEFDHQDNRGRTIFHNSDLETFARHPGLSPRVYQALTRSMNVRDAFGQVPKATSQHYMQDGPMSPVRTKVTLEIAMRGNDKILFEQVLGSREKGRTVLMNFLRLAHQDLKLHPRTCDRLTTWKEDFSWVIERHENIEARDKAGNTPLHYAVKYCIPLAVQELVRRNVNVNACNDKGISVMKVLAEAFAKHKMNTKIWARAHNCLTILLDRGAVLDPTIEQQMVAQCECFTSLQPKSACQHQPHEIRYINPEDLPACGKVGFSEVGLI